MVSSGKSCTWMLNRFTGSQPHPFLCSLGCLTMASSNLKCWRPWGGCQWCTGCSPSEQCPRLISLPFYIQTTPWHLSPVICCFQVHNSCRKDLEGHLFSASWVFVLKRDIISQTMFSATSVLNIIKLMYCLAPNRFSSSNCKLIFFVFLITRHANGNARNHFIVLSYRYNMYI